MIMNHADAHATAARVGASHPRARLAGLAVLLSLTLITQGCAAAMQGGGRRALLSDGDLVVLADYVQRLPAGTAVRVERARGGTLRGTLLAARADAIVIQPRTRLPEPPREIPLADVLAVTPDQRDGGSGMGQAVAAGAAAGAGAALAVFFILVAIFSN